MSSIVTDHVMDALELTPIVGPTKTNFSLLISTHADDDRRVVVSELFHIIYKTTFLKTGQYYFGLHTTSNLDDGYLGSGKWVDATVRKYGRDLFTREIMERCVTRDQLCLREIAFIADNKHDTLCMNFASGGDMPPSRKGTKHSAESILKMRQAQQGKKHSPKTITKMKSAQLGKKHSPERTSKKRQFKPRPRMRGRKLSIEHRAKIGLASKGRNVGRVHTLEESLKMSEAAHRMWVRRRAKVPE